MYAILFNGSEKGHTNGHKNIKPFILFPQCNRMHSSFHWISVANACKQQNLYKQTTSQQTECHSFEKRIPLMVQTLKKVGETTQTLNCPVLKCFTSPVSTLLTAISLRVISMTTSRGRLGASEHHFFLLTRFSTGAVCHCQFIMNPLLIDAESTKSKSDICSHSDDNSESVGIIQ